MTKTKEKTKELSAMSNEELMAELERRKKAERTAYEKAKKEFTKNKEAFLKKSVVEFQAVQEQMNELKTYTITKANELYEQMYRMEGKEVREVQSFTMKDEKDRYKVVVDRQDILEFNENAEVHINDIKEIFKNKFETRNKAMYGYLNDLLVKNGKGDYDPKLITKVRKRAVEYGHTEILQELEKLEQCRRVSGTALYCRCYVRDKNKKWRDITLQFSAL